VEKDDPESENLCRIYVKIQVSLGAQDRVHKPSKLNIGMKICNMSSYSRKARWHVYDAGAMLDKRI
jgi:hypothetical protein